MLFNSLNFLVFFPVVVMVYYLLPRRICWIWLLVSSYYFYMSWSPRYAILMAISTSITFFSGIGIDKLEKLEAIKNKTKWKKAVVAISFIANIGILMFFKYFDFLLDHLNIFLRVVGMSAVTRPFDIILPVGISFYTFQALGYTVDVYRGDIKAEKNIFRYALFVPFFPQLVAGPIERSTSLLRQVSEVPERRHFDSGNVVKGLEWMLWGLFLKMVIADRIAIMVNTVFDQYYLYHSFALIVGAVSFAIQVYCDFASYSVIALGAAKVLGFEMTENFKVPYFSLSIREFWRRWHISLSAWFRDYLYIPLGGNRHGRLRKHVNTMIVFLVSGLWHGANRTFVLWGGGCMGFIKL